MLKKTHQKACERLQGQEEQSYLVWWDQNGDFWNIFQQDGVLKHTEKAT